MQHQTEMIQNRLPSDLSDGRFDQELMKMQ
jgi:hypothetical protein